MTIRQIINRSLIPTRLIGLVGLSIFLAFVLTQNDWLLVTAVAALIVFKIIEVFIGKCPRCHGAIASACNRSVFGISKTFRHCPFCGVHLDTEWPPSTPQPSPGEATRNDTFHL